MTSGAVIEETAVSDPMVIIMELISRAPDAVRDPYSRYRALRESAPRCRIEFETGTGYVLTSYDDCRQALRDPRMGKEGQRPHLGDDRGVAGARTLLFLDPPHHTRLRGLISRAFTPRRVEGLKPRLARFVDQLLGEIQESIGAGGEVDLIASFAFRLPVMVIGELVGVPRSDWGLLRQLTKTASSSLEMFANPEVLQVADQALAEMEAYFNALVTERRASPRDDLTSALAAAEIDGDRLSVAELVSVLVLLFGAGFQTMTDLIGLGTVALSTHPEELARLRADRSLLPSAIEELLRFDSPVHVLGRAAKEDATFADGQPIAAGEHLITLVGAANRDPAKYRQPDRLDLGRFVEADTPEPLSFAWGVHHCLGAPLARAEGQLAFGGLLERFGSISVVDDTLHWRDSHTFRGLESLRVHLTPV
jgi:cytochrome P450